MTDNCPQCGLPVPREPQKQGKELLEDVDQVLAHSAALLRRTAKILREKAE